MISRRALRVALVLGFLAAVAGCSEDNPVGPPRAGDPNQALYGATWSGRGEAVSYLGDSVFYTAEVESIAFRFSPDPAAAAGVGVRCYFAGEQWGAGYPGGGPFVESISWSGSVAAVVVVAPQRYGSAPLRFSGAFDSRAGSGAGDLSCAGWLIPGPGREPIRLTVRGSWAVVKKAAA